MIEILTPARVFEAAGTGALVADILRTLQQRCEPGTNLLDIDRWAEQMIREAGARSCYVDYVPSGFGRGPFGHYICTGVNEAVLHARPHDRRLADGDLLSLDLAVVRNGVAADAAISFVVGDAIDEESTALIAATERALAAGIDAARHGGARGLPQEAQIEATAGAGLHPHADVHGRMHVLHGDRSAEDRGPV